MEQFYGFSNDCPQYADLHMHTSRSDGSLTPEQLIEKAVGAGLSAVAITDHEVIKPAVEGWEYNQKRGYPLEVVVGSEITTCNGHLIGLFLHGDIPSGKTAEWTVKQIHNKGDWQLHRIPSLFGLVR